MTYTIPCPKGIGEIKDLLPASAPIRLSAVKPTGKERILTFTVTPMHSFDAGGTNRNKLVSELWSSVAPHLTHNSTCVLRQHGRQTVLQINL